MKADIINSVVNQYSNSDYNPFNKNGGAYYITRQTVSDIYEYNKREDVKKQRLLGLIIGNIALFSSLAAFLIFKTVPSGMSDRLNKLSKRLEERIGKEENNLFKRFYNNTLKATKRQIDRVKSINNYTTFKDLIFKDAMYKTSFTRKIHDGITKMFEKFSRRTVDRRYKFFENSYSNFSNEIDNLNKKIQDIDKIVTINGESKTVKEWMERANELRAVMTSNIGIGFSEQSRNARYNKLPKITENLEAKVKDSVLKNKKIDYSQISQTFLAEDVLAADKSKMNNEVKDIRVKITRNILDNYRDSIDLLNDIIFKIEPIDESAHESIEFIKNELRVYKKMKGITEASFRQSKNESLIKYLDSLSKQIENSKFKYDKQTIDEINKDIDGIKSVIWAPKGAMQELLTIYKNILPEKSYKKLRSKSEVVTKNLDIALNTEVNDFFDKYRDLKLGSAFTDVLFSMVVPVATAGLSLTFADDKDKRVSALLKYGIPIVGGITTTFMFALNLVSGFKGLFFGLLSSIVLNDIGDALDKFRLNVKKREQLKLHKFDNIKSDIIQFRAKERMDKVVPIESAKDEKIEPEAKKA